jgi:hypothetical protein
MNICVIGNSHVGAIKRGWDEINSDFSNVSVTFYCARGHGLNSLYSLDDKVLVSDDPIVTESLKYTSKKDGTIKLRDYDAIFIYGLGLKSQSINFGSYFSKGFMDIFSKKAILSSLNFKVVKLVARITDSPIYVGANPLPPLFNKFNESIEIKNLDYMAWVNYFSELFLSTTKLIPQPVETIINNTNTIGKYSVGSKKIQLNSKEEKEFSGNNIHHNQNDIEHMNDDYGVIYMNNIIKEILNNA